ncbi:MAG: hypothetical protein ACM3ML_17645 [Micromonosporaceae bacterium]
MLIDATIVCGILLPAAMTLPGKRNWYLPRWLARLPGIRLEAQASGLAFASARSPSLNSIRSQHDDVPERA